MRRILRRSALLLLAVLLLPLAVGCGGGETGGASSLATSVISIGMPITRLMAFWILSPKCLFR